MSHGRSDPEERANVYVTSAYPDAKDPRTFPCPLCGLDLDLRRSKSEKPYCVCLACGVQLFFRGKKGIARLGDLMEARHRIVGGPMAAASAAVHAFDRLEHLRAQRSKLEERRPFLVTDDDLENAISAVDVQIERVRAVLDHLAREQQNLAPPPQT